MPVTFSTPRLDVRPLTRDDLQPFHAIWSDPAVIFWGAMSTLNATRRFLEQVIGRRYDGHEHTGWFAVVSKEHGHVVGDVVLVPSSWDALKPEIGWHFARRHHGRGFATEAATGLLDHARRLGIGQVFAKILPTNHPSRRVARRVGMQVVGRLPHDYAEHELWATIGTWNRGTPPTPQS